MKRLKLNELQTECVLEVIPRMVPQTKAAIMNGNIMATMASQLFWGDVQGKQHGNTTCKIYKASATCKAVCKSSPSTRLEQECMIDAVGLDRRFHMF